MLVRYQPNNIIFRIASSDSISKFKQSQAHAFIQLARPELQFDVAAREVVLLEFDRLSQWLYRIERILQGIGDNDATAHLKNTLIGSFIDEMTTIEGVMLAHHEIFTETVVEFTRIIHNYSRPLITNEISELGDGNVGRTFSSITEHVMEYLQHVLACLHEYNNNLVRHHCEPFVSVSNFSVRTAQSNPTLFPVLKRIEFFREKTGASDYILKNYSNMESAFDVLVSALEGTSITLIPEDLCDDGHSEVSLPCV